MFPLNVTILYSTTLLLKNSKIFFFHIFHSRKFGFQFFTVAKVIHNLVIALMLHFLIGQVHELENTLHDEQRRHNEDSKAIRKQDKRIKELQMQVEDERKTQQSMADQNNVLHSKIKLFKQQLEEAVSFTNYFLR